MFLLVGRIWPVARVFLFPIIQPLYAYANVDINYHADIGPGIVVLHCAVGIVISGHAMIGSNLTLTGGNVIGARPSVRSSALSIGDNCSLGANAVVLGPLVLGSNVTVGALAMVNKSFGSDCTLVGVPATASGKMAGV
jgi:serine acetyltransferase